MTQKTYTVPQAAEFYHMPVRSFERHIKKIKRAKIGRRLLFTEESLLAYMESKSSKPVRDLQSS